jgi:predicted ATPase
VLDNFEQILPAAPLVDDLLRRCPWLHVLVTSRQPLRVRAERQIIVHPLALPTTATGTSPITAKHVLQYSAVALFAERAQAVLSDFAVDDANAAAVSELCRRLDGLPLAIELVAARVKLLPPAGLLSRLQGPWLLSVDGIRDVSARHRSLRGAIGWSYDLLTPLEQTLFRSLSVCVGGFTLEAAELLCGDTLSPPFPLTLAPSQVLDGIASLLEKSLLVREMGPSERVRPFVELASGYGAEGDSTAISLTF